VHDDYELPDEVDFSRTKFVGIGIEALERHVTDKNLRVISLDPDVALEFRTA